MSILFKKGVNWKYAIGEVVLIFFGITLAIAFNNWNDERKEMNQRARQGREYLIEINNDLKNEIQSYQLINDQLIRQRDGAISQLQIVENPDNPITDSIQFYQDQLQISFSVPVDRKRNAWDDLESTGTLHFVADDTLKAKLFQYYAYYDSRIKNFNEVPKAIRMEYRLLSSPCKKLKDMESAFTDNQMYIPSKEWFSCFLSYPKLHEILVTHLETTLWNLIWFSELEDQNLSLIEYMEKNHSDILISNR